MSLLNPSTTPPNTRAHTHTHILTPHNDTFPSQKEGFNDQFLIRRKCENRFVLLTWKRELISVTVADSPPSSIIKLHPVYLSFSLLALWSWSPSQHTLLVSYYLTLNLFSLFCPMQKSCQRNQRNLSLAHRQTLRFVWLHGSWQSRIAGGVWFGLATECFQSICGSFLSVKKLVSLYCHYTIG